MQFIFECYTVDAMGGRLVPHFTTRGLPILSILMHGWTEMTFWHTAYHKPLSLSERILSLSPANRWCLFIMTLKKIYCQRKEQVMYSICLSLCADVCNSTDLPELEIISLLEEQLPVYKLRADTIFGYDQDDWLHTPLVEPDSALDLTTEQIEETLKYFCKFISYCCFRWLSVKNTVYIKYQVWWSELCWSEIFYNKNVILSKPKSEDLSVLWSHTRQIKKTLHA